MKKQFTILSILLLITTMMISGCTTDKNQISVDVCVYGGTAGGVIAAYSAKKLGKSVILIEPSKHLGGMTTGGLGSTDIGNKQAITGLAHQFYCRIGKHYGKDEQWTFPPSVASEVIDSYIKEAQIDVMYQKRIIKADVENHMIKTIALEDAADSNIQPIIIKAKQFIDCSYEGDLMAHAGVSFTVGRESNSTYGETFNGSSLAIYHQFPDGIDPYKIEGDSTSGLCWGISPSKLTPAGSGDSLVQAYNFRLCLTDVEANRRPFEKPANYDPSMYELLGRAAQKMDQNINLFLLINWDIMPDRKFDVNNRGPLSTDMIGANHDYPTADYATREKICEAHINYTKGLMYYMTHDEKMPKSLREEIGKLGWAKDEFIDNDNFPTQLYVREARRMIGEYVMTQNNCEGREVVKDSIGMAAYTMDSHNCTRIVVDGMVKNEGDVQQGGFPPYHIAYRSLTPRREECTNLLVPACLSASHIAYGSIRMEPVFMVLGQSAATAACMAIDSDCAVQEIDVTALQTLLKEDPYLTKKLF
ncbi:MAG: FAD-dependent oxidoreductase [Rikenellaceae bacterium]